MMDFCESDVRIFHYALIRIFKITYSVWWLVTLNLLHMVT